MSILVLSEAELRRTVGLTRAAMAAVEEGFAALGRGGVDMPPILHLAIPERNAEMDVKTAYVPGLPAFALKISTGFFDNPKRGLASLSGMMTLISAETGRVEAALLDNGYLTDIRTALAGAIAADRLARADAKIAGIIGAGLQARCQLEALCLVRPIERALVWARDPGKAAAYAREMSKKLGIEVVTGDAEMLTRQSDTMVTTTPARAPLVSAGWLRPGQHVTAMGSDAEGKNELDPRALAKADLVVVDRRSQCARLGELAAALRAGAVSSDLETPELGEIVSGIKSGRTDDGQLTICDLTGTGVQDTAIALYAWRAASAAGAGVMIDA